ncbi:MAG TPA: NUDIX domain-containing protein [Arachnia sp.]|nr:NUDIX domain-containing protein [Arachnia sp.]HQD21321.1 NUDIX domain-containing protein [Arachnia sp.]
MVRKRGTSMWMNPGGKPEPGESAAECAAREVAEELGLSLDVERLVRLGSSQRPRRTRRASRSSRTSSTGRRRSPRTFNPPPRSRRPAGSLPTTWPTTPSHRCSWTTSLPGSPPSVRSASTT